MGNYRPFLQGPLPVANYTRIIIPGRFWTRPPSTKSTRMASSATPLHDSLIELAIPDAHAHAIKWYLNIYYIYTNSKPSLGTSPGPFARELSCDSKGPGLVPILPYRFGIGINIVDVKPIILYRILQEEGASAQTTPDYIIPSLLPAQPNPSKNAEPGGSAHLPRKMPLVNILIMEISLHTDHGPAVAGDMA